MTDAKKRPMSDAERAELAQKMDEDLDRFMEELAEKKKSEGSTGEREPFDFDKWCAEIDQHPAFMTDLKKAENGEYSDYVQALQAMKYDETDEDADETAEHAKTEGNKYFKLKKFRWARDAYTNGIKAKCTNRELNSILYANRAAAQKHLGNVLSAIRDSVFAQRFNPHNTKAVLRGAECLLELGYAGRCIGWIDKCRLDLADESKRIEMSSDNPGEPKVVDVEEEQKQLAAFHFQLETIRAKAESRRMTEERDERRRKAEERRTEQEKRWLLTAFRQRHLRFTPQFDFDSIEEFDLGDICIRSPYTKEILQDRVYVDPKNPEKLVWPLLLQYVGKSQTDMIKDCHESTTLGDLVAPVFEQPAPWDTLDFEYRVDNIRFFLPLDVFEDRQVEELSLKQTVGEIVAIKDHTIVYGLPIIQVYTKQKAEEELEPLNSKRFRLR